MPLLCKQHANAILNAFNMVAAVVPSNHAPIAMCPLLQLAWWGVAFWGAVFYTAFGRGGKKEATEPEAAAAH